MPCYQVSLISVELKFKNKEVLLEALKALNFTGYDKYRQRMSYEQTADMIINTGKIDVANNFYSNKEMNAKMNELKRAYTREAIRVAAKKKKWAMKVNAKNRNKLQLVRY